MSIGASVQEKDTWVDAWSPVREEFDRELTDIAGIVPREINGTLFRNGPSQRIDPTEGYGALHLFDGDGLVHAFKFDDGRVQYRSRFVRTELFEEERAEGRVLQNFMGVNVADADDSLAPRFAMNTNVIPFAGSLFALLEIAPPFELDRDSLEPRGWKPFGEPHLGPSTSAHPKIDGKTGQLVIHGYQPFPPYVQIYILEPDGRCSLAETIDVPGPSMLHDLAITADHIVLPYNPVDFEFLPGAPVLDWLSWAPDKPLRFAVRGREAGAQVRWFDAPSSGFIVHVGNAYEADGKILIDAGVYRDGGLILEAIRHFRAGKVAPTANAELVVYELDLRTGTCTERVLDDRGWEFQRLDDRRVGHKNSFGYAVTGPGGGLWPGEKWTAKYSQQSGLISAFKHAPSDHPSEPIFVPRAVDANEDDGYLLTVVYDGVEQRSQLQILDASDLSQPPIARINMDVRVPLGFHGNFAAAPH